MSYQLAEENLPEGVTFVLNEETHQVRHLDRNSFELVQSNICFSIKCPDFVVSSVVCGQPLRIVRQSALRRRQLAQPNGRGQMFGFAS